MKPPRQKIRAFLLLYYRRLLSLEKMHVELMKRARTKEVTGLLHISDRLLAVRGALCPIANNYHHEFSNQGVKK